MSKAKLTCPQCGHKQEMKIPKDKCLPFYECHGCGKIISAKRGSCCVICDYSGEKCPVSVKK